MIVTERLKKITTWHFRGISNRKIAEMLGVSTAMVARDVKTITSRIKEFDDIDKHLRNTIERLSEELTKIGELEAEQWQLLDWAQEPVIQTHGPFMAPIPVLDPTDAQQKKDPLTGRPLWEMGPRKPAMIPTIVAQIAALSKQKAELLKLIGPKVDITVNLQMQLKMQMLIMDKLKTLDPATYTQLYRELQVVQAAANGQHSLAKPAEEAIDAEFVERAV